MAVLYRMWLVWKSCVLHPFSVCIIDFDTGTITTEELFMLRKQKRAADQLADACRDSGDERIMAAREAYLKTSGQ